MRDKMMAAVIRRALEHRDFREQLARNPEEALEAHGFALEDEELAEVRRLSLSSDQSSEEQLRAIGRKFGLEPNQTE